MLTIEDLKQQLASSEAELENAKSHVYRLDGITQLLKHQIKTAEEKASKKEADETPKEG